MHLRDTSVEYQPSLLVPVIVALCGVGHGGCLVCTFGVCVHTTSKQRQEKPAFSHRIIGIQKHTGQNFLKNSNFMHCSPVFLANTQHMLTFSTCMYG